MRFARWLCCLLLLGTVTIRAHVVEAIYVKFDIAAHRSWEATVFFDAGYALPEMRADTNAPQPKREWLTSQSDEEWEKLRAGAEAYLREWIHFSIVNDAGESTPASWTVGFPDFDTQPPDFPKQLDGGAYMRVVISGELDEGDLELHVSDGDHPRLTLSLDGSISTVSPGGQIIIMTADRQNHSGKITKNSTLNNLTSFVWLGFHHVLPWGADHVLFILALFIYSPRWRPLLHQSIMFTVAHSLTLGLMMSGAIHANPSIVEPLIALSIAWVACEHLVLPNQTGGRRLASVFVFGLIHGLGFASSLRKSLPVEDNWVMPLVSANVGIELAQLSILGLCLLVFYRFIDSAWFGRLRQVVAIAIGITGLWWCLERMISGA